MMVEGKHRWEATGCVKQHCKGRNTEMEKKMRDGQMGDEQGVGVTVPDPRTKVIPINDDDGPKLSGIV